MFSVGDLDSNNSVDSVLEQIVRMNPESKKLKKRLEPKDYEKIIDNAKISQKAIEDKIAYYIRRISTEVSKMARLSEQSEELRGYIEKLEFEYKECLEKELKTACPKCLPKDLICECSAKS